MSSMSRLCAKLNGLYIFLLASCLNLNDKRKLSNRQCQKMTWPGPMHTWHDFLIMAMAKPKEVSPFLFFFCPILLVFGSLFHVPKVEEGGTMAK